MRWSKVAPPQVLENPIETHQHFSARAQSLRGSSPVAKLKSAWRAKGARGSRGGQQHRGGQVRTRGQDPDRDQGYMSVFFGNITSYSAHAAFYIAGRSEDVLLLAETHQNKEKTLKMVAELGANSWQTTTSPAQPSDKSMFGNISGVAVAVNIFIDNRASSSSTDEKGNLSGNPFVTARTVAIQTHELQALAAYLEGGGLKGNNLRTLEAIDHLTRGGKDLFFCGLYGNIEPEE